MTGETPEYAPTKGNQEKTDRTINIIDIIDLIDIMDVIDSQKEKIIYWQKCSKSQKVGCWIYGRTLSL